MKTTSLTIAICVAASTLAAQEWTRFRGPMGQGIGKAPDLPAAFTKEHVEWQVDLGGEGHSSPVFWGDALFVTRNTDESGVRELVCLDAHNGKERWATKCEFEPHRQHKFNSFASATPAVDASGIYLAWSSGAKLFGVAFDHKGKRTWRKELGSFRAQHGSGSSPVLCNGLVVIANENESDTSFLVALDQKTGDTKWRIARDTFPRRGAYSVPVLYTPKAGASYLLFTSTAHGLTAVDPKAGKVLWETELDLNQRCVNTPAIAGDLVFFSGGSGGGGKEAAIVKLPGKPDGKPTVVKQPRRRLPYVPCALALGDRFYLITDGGVASCIQAANAKAVWRGRFDSGFFSSPVTNGKTIWIPGKEGSLFSYAVGDEFKETGRFELDDTAYATPAIAHGKLYVRTARKLFCFGSGKSDEKKGGR